ncbi:MAG: diguanylate cyclase [Eubacteriales bacterium]|nr:diguanylate cyclase [Eubacteriales bacterium]
MTERKTTRRHKTRRVDVQVSIFTAVVAIVSCLLTSAIHYNLTHADMLRSLEDRARAVGDYIVAHVDERVFTELDTPDDIYTDLYMQAHQTFCQGRDLTGVQYLYTGKRNDKGELIYVMDCIDPTAPDFRHPGDPMEPDTADEMAQALEGEPVISRTVKDTEWGKIFVAYLPVFADDGSVLGVIGLEFEAEHQYATYHLLRTIWPILAAIICILCAVIARVMFRRISNPLYKDMINTDYLTNLKSRNAFDIDLENLRAQRDHTGVGFCVIDLNDLKKVNDTLGHEAGDHYLQFAARSFRSTAKRDVTIYRVGGDEFVLLTETASDEGLSQLARDLQTRFELNKPQWAIDLSFSIGWAVYDPAIDANLTATYRRADSAMYEHKRAHHAQARPRELSSTEA